jgi:uncharacterized protein YndB with AHSA1/START domain
MLKAIVVVVVVGIAALLIFAATKPDTFRIERSASIKAPPDKVFALLTNFQGWGAWSPWEKKDPAMKRVHRGAASGKGAIYEWDGNKDVGQGRMEITDVSPPSKVVIKLDFIKPFEAHNIVEFTLEPKGDTTNVAWVMHGPSPYITKVMTLFFDMDQMVGKDFETGLANLKSVAEK